MSLVGSLEDLGLGDILQIISLSRKSGVLVLRAQGGSGQIVFEQGLIRGAFADGLPASLHALLHEDDALDKVALEGAYETGRHEGRALSELLVERGLVAEDAIDELRRDHIERAVLRMFSWPTGEFSFEIRARVEDAGEDLFVERGVNPQFLALEGSRVSDEVGRPGEEEADPWDGEVSFSGEDDPDAVVAPIVTEEAELFAEPLDDAESAGWDELAEAEVIEADPVAFEEESIAPSPMEPVASPPAESEAPEAPSIPPVIVIDGHLATLEWIKVALADCVPRVHIFQRTEQGINRIRQYLARGQVPAVLLASDAPEDALSGASDVGSIVARLRAQSQQMTIVVLTRPGEPVALQGADASAVRPTQTQLADPRRQPELEGAAETLRRCVLGAFSADRSDHASEPAELLADDMTRLRQTSARMRDPASQGEVLSLALLFAAETFSRVAIFMIREDQALAIAQVGLPRAGGPDDAHLTGVVLPHQEPAWFRRVLDGSGPERHPPDDDGDQRLAILLGNAVPAEAYVAPIETGDQIVALLYGDNLPAGNPIGDTAALEVILHEAGLALDRAALERALAESEHD